MTCNDCLHAEVCGTFAIASEIFEISSPERTASSCNDFKDRSRFVELPCKLGDEIFCTTMGKIYQGIVGRIELDDEGFNIITTDGYCFDSSICYHTQEEAEKAVNMKERENNAN